MTETNFLRVVFWTRTGIVILALAVVAILVR